LIDNNLDDYNFLKRIFGMKKHVVVVGAGPGGLTSAMILAHRGFEVTIFEKGRVVSSLEPVISTRLV